MLAAALAASAAPPSVNFPSKDQTVVLYQPAGLGVIASPDALGVSCQWHKDRVPIAGATNDQIVFAHAQFSDAGRYSVVVSNAEGSATSEASLVVNPPKAGDLDCSFGCGGSINGLVRSVVVQPDGKVLVGGDFSAGIARLNADGTTDYTFMNGLTGVADYPLDYPQVYSIAVQSDGKVLIGGAFRIVNGVRRIGIARPNADGTLDTGFQNEINAYAVVNSIAVQSDGKVIIGGNFTTVNVGLSLRRQY